MAELCWQCFARLRQGREFQFPGEVWARILYTRQEGLCKPQPLQLY